MTSNCWCPESVVQLERGARDVTQIAGAVASRQGIPGGAAASAERWCYFAGSVYARVAKLAKIGTTVGIAVAGIRRRLEITVEINLDTAKSTPPTFENASMMTGLYGFVKL
jgi:hypothetical protein